MKLIAGMITSDRGLFTKVEELLSKRFGEIDFKSEIFPFEHTDYYNRELGTPLLRKFISFERHIDPKHLPKIKSLTNRMEKRLTRADGRRRINIDPGYLNDAKLVLASTKDSAHRIYLSKGIYAEVTLFFYKGSFRFYNWTYPDYKSREYIQVFNSIRQLYRRVRRKGSKK